MPCHEQKEQGQTHGKRNDQSKVAAVSCHNPTWHFIYGPTLTLKLSQPGSCSYKYICFHLYNFLSKSYAYNTTGAFGRSFSSILKRFILPY